ncbi:hypothetical protein E2C01_015396 [Portunus trituberculatus]|uniref:Uncharacterized protein n=1 Tax=Portunus trituberculatus TaxID=210409 RepID=A0A5B7DLF4_PORTR|nr:hypothetical protein [Portunus trituberculatus]
MVYHVRHHTLPVMCCIRCLLFGHGNISCNEHARCRKFSGFHETDGCVREDHCLFYGPNHRPTSKQCPVCLQAVQLQELQHEKACSLLDIKRKMRGILPSTFHPPKPTPQTHSPSKTGHPLPPSLLLTHPRTPRGPTSAPTLHSRPTPFQAPTPAPILDPTPAPTKPLSPIISVVPLTAQPPTPKAQWTHHHHKPHYTVTPQHTTRPSFIPKGPYRIDITDARKFVPPTPLHQCHPPKTPQPKPHSQQPSSPCPCLVAQALHHLSHFRPNMLRVLFDLLLLRD